MNNKIKITVLLILLKTLTECGTSPTLPTEFNSYIRPWLFGRQLKHQLSALVFANLTNSSYPLIAEMDCNYNTTDPVYIFQVYINSVYNTNYFVDGLRCTIRKSSNNFLPFVVPSFVVAEYIQAFNRDSNRKYIREHTECPGHNDKPCHEWEAVLNDGTPLNVYFYNNILYRITVDRVQTFALDFDYYEPDNPLVPEQFRPPGIVIGNCLPPN